MKRTILSLALAAQVVAVPALAATQDPTTLSYEDHTACAAMFFILSDRQADAETAEAFEAATGVMLNRAQTVPGGRGLSDEVVVDSAVVKAADIQNRIGGIADANQQNAVINGYGPGIQACLDEVLTQR